MADTVRLDRDRGRFEVTQDGLTAFTTFKLRGTVLSILHTEVPPELEGHGVGTALVRAALDWARSEHFTVKPYCPFTAAYMRRHPQTQDLLDREFPWQA